MPVYRNATTLRELHERLGRVLQGSRWEVIFVNDASPDDAIEVLRDLVRADEHVVAFSLPENRGQNRAVLIGLAHTRGEAIVVMDADLQDPPEAIPVLHRALHGDVMAVFGGRRGHYKCWHRTLTSFLFKRALHLVTRCRVPVDAGLFVAMRRRMAEYLIRRTERRPHVVGLMGCSELRLLSIPVPRARRPDGRSAYGSFQRIRLAVNALVGTIQALRRRSASTGPGPAMGRDCVRVS